jgi:hypothetical protein
MLGAEEIIEAVEEVSAEMRGRGVRIREVGPLTTVI